MAVTKDDVVTIAPELSSVADGTFSAFITDAEVMEDFAAFEEEVRDIARKYFVAHLLVSNGHGASGGRGPVSSESVGSVSRSYAVSALPPNSEASLASTRWGAFYLRLKRARAPRFLVVP